MNSVKSGLLAAVMILLPAAAHADEWERHGGAEARPAPPQASHPSAPAPVPRAPHGDGGFDGGRHGPQGNGLHEQWQGHGGGNGHTPGSDWSRSNSRTVPPQAIYRGQQASTDHGNWRHDGGDQHGNVDPGLGYRRGNHPSTGDHSWNGDGQNRSFGDHRWAGGDHRGNDDHHNDGGRHWDGGWRVDHRYDWHSWRSGHGNLFRGHYYAPHGYQYRPVYRGFRLDAFFYGQNYWLADPFAYRLPPVEWPLHWVRYYNDAVLVDVTTGEVVDTIPQFFW